MSAYVIQSHFIVDGFNINRQLETMLGSGDCHE